MPEPIRRLRHICAVLACLGGIFLAGCVSEPLRDVERDSAPRQVPDGLENLPDPVVRDEAPSRYGNRRYEVFGRQYDVMSSARGYRERGNASWYGTKFHGRTTSSGEPYDMFQLTAAHRSLPLPTFVRVKNLENEKETIVRVNDRGPFHPDRIIDLSYAAAVKLGFDAEGTAPVLVEALTEKDFTVQQPVVARPLDLRVGPYATLDAADAATRPIVDLLEAEGSAVRVGVARTEGAYFIRVGPVESRRGAERLKAVLAFHERGVPVVIEE